MRDRIRAVLAQTFDVPIEGIAEDLTSEEFEEWDSLRHLELMLEIELEFGVTISSETIPELLSIDAIEAYLVEQGVADQR